MRTASCICAAAMLFAAGCFTPVGPVGDPGAFIPMVGATIGHENTRDIIYSHAVLLPGANGFKQTEHSFMPIMAGVAVCASNGFHFLMFDKARQEYDAMLHVRPDQVIGVELYRRGNDLRMVIRDNTPRITTVGIALAKGFADLAKRMRQCVLAGAGLDEQGEG